jgi:hypothetical protein
LWGAWGAAKRIVMDVTEKILLGLLLLAFAAFPIAVFLYLRTAYRKDGWTDVKGAAMIAGVSLLIWVGVSLWPEFEIRHILHAIQRPFALGSIVFLVLLGLAHCALKARIESHDIQ